LGFFHPKNIISTHTKDFCETNNPNSPDFEFFVLNIPDLPQVPAAIKIKKGFLKKSPSTYDHSQIWVNLLVDDCEFGYIEKLGKKKP
jgi:hypothetical protein